MRSCYYLQIVIALFALLSETCCAIRFRAIDVLNNVVEEVEEEREKLSRNGSGPHHHHYDIGNGSDVQELFFQQRLDHFSSDSRTYQQRYFYSDRYVKKCKNNSTTTRTLAFLCVGGEGPAMNRSVLIDSVHCTGDMLEFAKSIHEEYSIHLFALEHRYYGKSYPTFSHRHESPVSNKNLVYLSSRQAIADIAHFISRQSHTGGDTNKATWIAFGGSYPGMLAAWSRLKIPHLIYAAISSSAPVQQILDMAVYNAHVAKAFADSTIGGSPECLSIVQQGHAELAQAVQNQSRFREIGEVFRLCDASLLRNMKNVQMFLGDGAIISHVQTNNPSCTAPLCNVNKICQALINQTVQKPNNASNMHALAWVAQRQIKEDCVNISWKDTVRYIADPIRGKRGGLRSWLWQTCTEVGYYQTCEANSTCPFARGYHPLSKDLLLCQKAFGVKPWEVYNNVQETLEYYGGWKLQASRVLSITGSVDPWSELALQKSGNTKDRPVYQVPGASHHFWTRPVEATDGNEIQVAREIIFMTLRRWLDHPEQQVVVPQLSLQ